MSILASLLGEQNPVAQFTGRNRNALSGLGASLLSSGMNFAPMQQGAAMDLEMAERAKQEAKTAETENQTMNWLQSAYPEYANLPVEQGFRLALEAEQARRSGSTSMPSSVQEYEYAKANGFGGSFADWMQTGRNGAGGPQLGMTPQWAIDPQTGEYVLTQMSSDGSLHRTDMGGLVPVDPFTLAGGKKGATVDAETAGKARAAMRGAEVANANTAKAIAEVRNNAKGMAEWFGQIGPRGMYIHPGSEMGKFYAAAEPTNNQAFMQARETLKGGGQITDYEGRKAEDAFSRMRAAMEKGDQEQYLRALADFEEAVALGYQKIVEAANGGYSAGSPAVTRGGQSGDIDALVQKWSNQ